jgi:hypothetical protein
MIHNSSSYVMVKSSEKEKTKGTRFEHAVQATANAAWHITLLFRSGRVGFPVSYYSSFLHNHHTVLRQRTGLHGDSTAVEEGHGARIRQYLIVARLLRPIELLAKPITKLRSKFSHEELWMLCRRKYVPQLQSYCILSQVRPRRLEVFDDATVEVVPPACSCLSLLPLHPPPSSRLYSFYPAAWRRALA